MQQLCRRHNLPPGWTSDILLLRKPIGSCINCSSQLHTERFAVTEVTQRWMKGLLIRRVVVPESLPLFLCCTSVWDSFTRTELPELTHHFQAHTPPNLRRHSDTQLMLPRGRLHSEGQRQNAGENDQRLFNGERTSRTSNRIKEGRFLFGTQAADKDKNKMLQAKKRFMSGTDTSRWQMSPFVIFFMVTEGSCGVIVQHNKTN